MGVKEYVVISWESNYDIRFSIYITEVYKKSQMAAILLPIAFKMVYLAY